MRRRAFRFFVCTLLFWWATWNCCAQEPRLAPPVSFGMPTIPKIDAPVEVEIVEAPPKAEVPISPNTGMPRLEQPKDGYNIGMVQLALESSEFIDARYVANSMHPDDMGIWESMRTSGSEQFRRLIRD